MVFFEDAAANTLKKHSRAKVVLKKAFQTMYLFHASIKVEKVWFWSLENTGLD
jgi:ABC-type branched-subunit amino acid transport system ATPase component